MFFFDGGHILKKIKHKIAFECFFIQIVVDAGRVQISLLRSILMTCRQIHVDIGFPCLKWRLYQNCTAGLLQ